MELNCKWRKHNIKRQQGRKTSVFLCRWHVGSNTKGKDILLLSLCGHLEFLSIGDFVCQTPDPLVSSVHPQARNILQQSLIPPSVVPDRWQQVMITSIAICLWCILVSCATQTPVLPVMVCCEDSRQGQALSLHYFKQLAKKTNKKKHSEVIPICQHISQYLTRAQQIANQSSVFLVIHQLSNHIIYSFYLNWTSVRFGQ